jgi:Tfp pilus assembly protein PilO
MKGRPWYTYAIIGILIVGFFYFIYYKPKGKELTSLRTERQKIEAEVKKAQRKKQDLDKIEAELKTLGLTLATLEAIIPQKKEMSDILRRIQQLAYDSRLNIRRFAPQKLADKEFFSEQPISIEMTGNYHNLGMFFDQLSRFSRLFIVENFSIKSLARQTDASTVSVSCTTKTYIFHEEKAMEKKASAPKGGKKT